MTGIEVANSTNGAFAFVTAAAGDDRVLVHVRHIANTGLGESQLLLLNLAGEVIARKAVPARAPGGEVTLKTLSSHSAVLAVSTEGSNTAHGFQWFRVEWPVDDIVITSLSEWRHGQTWIDPPRVITEAGAVLTLGRNPHTSAEAGDLGFAIDGPIPPTGLTRIGVERPSHYDGCLLERDRGLAAVAIDYQYLALFELSPRASMPITTFIPKGQRRGEIGAVRIVKRADGCAVFWRYYNKRVRRAERDAGLFMAGLDRETLAPHPAERLTDDREIVRWHVMNGDRSCILFWKNGISQKSQSVRFLEFDGLAELPGTPMDSDTPFPEATVETRDGRLAFWLEFTEVPYRWAVHASPF